MKVVKNHYVMIVVMKKDVMTVLKRSQTLMLIPYKNGIMYSTCKKCFNKKVRCEFCKKDLKKNYLRSHIKKHHIQGHSQEHIWGIHRSTYGGVRSSIRRGVCRGDRRDIHGIMVVILISKTLSNVLTTSFRR